MPLPFLLRSQGKVMPGSLHLVRKLGGRGRLNAVAARQLIHMVDHISNRGFLVDTGASYSILPHRPSLPAAGPKLFGRQVSSLLAGETAWCSCDSRIRIFLGNFFWQMLLFLYWK